LSFDFKVAGPEVWRVKGLPLREQLAEWI
jgi:hypothetical protein